MMASPLILGNDIRRMTPATKEIILNKEAIAIDQDTLCVQGLKYCSEDGLDFYFKPLAGGDWAMCILNASKEVKTYRLNWQRFNFTDEEVSKLSTLFDKRIYALRNVWSHKWEGKTSTKDKVSMRITVPAHDVVMYRLIYKK